MVRLPGRAADKRLLSMSIQILIDGWKREMECIDISQRGKGEGRDRLLILSVKVIGSIFGESVELFTKLGHWSWLMISVKKSWLPTKKGYRLGQKMITFSGKQDSSISQHSSLTRQPVHPLTE